MPVDATGFYNYRMTLDGHKIAVTAVTFSTRGDLLPGERGRSDDRRSRLNFQLEAKEKQALKLAEIREALVTAGYNTTLKQAAVLGLGRSTARCLLNHDKRAGPSTKIIKRILSSPQVPRRVRRKVEQYVEEKTRGPIWA
jgi:hypothetical protein